MKEAAIISVDAMLFDFYGEDIVAAALRPRLQAFLDSDFLTVTPDSATADLSQAIRIFSKEMVGVIARLTELYDDHADVMENPIRAAFPDKNKIREAAGGRVINTYKVDHRRPFALCDWRWLIETIKAHPKRNERDFYLFMALTGFRRIDVAHLHRDHWHPEDGTVRKRFSKSKVDAQIPVGPVARSLIDCRIGPGALVARELVFETKQFTSVPPNTHFYKSKLAGRPDLLFTTDLMRESWKTIASDIVGLDRYQIAQIAGDNVPILHDIEAVEQRRIWMTAIEERILELAESARGQENFTDAA